MNVWCIRIKAKRFDRYKRMCQKAKEIQNEHHIAQGDCIYHPTENVFEILKIRGDIIVATPNGAVNCPINQCAWLPSKDDLVAMFQEKESLEERFRDFLDDNPSLSCSRIEEEQWLAFYMFQQHRKYWDYKKNNWIEIDES